MTKRVSRTRTGLATIAALLLFFSGGKAAAGSKARHARASFVRVHKGHFELDGSRYAFVGTNFWYGPQLASEGPGGDRPRLARELDRLQSRGIRNLRIMAGSEGPDTEPWRAVPSLQPRQGAWNPSLWAGLDWLMIELAKRGLTAVLCLSNFWPWSGGFAQYVAWNGGGAIPYPPPAPDGNWDTFQAYASGLYVNPAAQKAYFDFVRAAVTRVNSYSGVKYSEDPTLLAWELANEPRGAGHPKEFNRWIAAAAQLIKGLDPNHLVTTGSEGDTPWSSAGNDFVANHRDAGIDYATLHIWAQNWGWYDPAHGAETFAQAVAKMKEYFQAHLEKARKLGKPAVLEEFGLGRDRGSFDPGAPVSDRDRYYVEVFEQVYQAALKGLPMAGVNFWAWAGEARPLEPFGGLWKPGNAWLGDPPHEPQGWYSVYDRDLETQQVISDYAAKLAALPNR
jgi:mannan endo-1,4-beta-mannosidase